MEPNVAEVFGDFKLLKRKGNQFEQMESESAVALYDAKGLSDMMSGTELDTVTLKEFVKIHFKTNVLSTDEAIYYAKTNEIKSNSSVNVKGTNQWFKSEKGFHAKLDDEIVDFYGQTSGEVLRRNKK